MLVGLVLVAGRVRVVRVVGLGEAVGVVATELELLATDAVELEEWVIGATSVEGLVLSTELKEPVLSTELVDSDTGATGLDEDEVEAELDEELTG